MDPETFYVIAFCTLSLVAVSSSQEFPGDQCIDSRGRNGVCTLITRCPVVQEELVNGMRPFHCGFTGYTPVVCCPSETSTSTPKAPPRVPGEKAAKWCEEYSKHCPELFAVSGGTPALPGEFPHMAAVGYGPQDNIQWQCGGSLISENFILTAAHCLHAGRIGPAQWVLLGTEILAPNSSFLKNRGQIHPVVRRIRHPGYKPPSKYHDVALLEIGPAISRDPLSTNSRELHPACLQIDDSFRYFSYVATGWGRVGHGEDPSLELLKVELDVFDEAKCNETFELEIRTTNLLRKGIDSTMLCAGILRGGKDTCQGDSGGPLQFAASGECKYEIWGITSFGKVCSFANSPSVYMKVSAYVDWIEDQVWP